MARHERGQILLLTLIILTIGVIIMGSLLLYLNTSMSASEKSEERAMTYYAADSGFEDAIFWIQQDKELAGWTETEEEQWEREPYTINDNRTVVDVNVVRKSVDGGTETYMIESTATYLRTGESIKIESYVLASSLNLSGFGVDAITSNCSVKIQPGTDIVGDVRYNSACELTCQPNCEAINITGEFIPDPPLGEPDLPPPGIDWWPEVEDLLYVFGAMVKNAPHLSEDIQILYVEDNPNIGPLYKEGDLQIISRVDWADLFLNDIIYVTGNLLIGKTNQDFTLHLGNATVFAEGDIQVGSKTTITGSGSIIALGDISFEPNMQSNPNDFVFIIAVEGEVNKLLPSGDFWGSVNGNDNVIVQPGNIVGHRDPQDVGFEFPGSDPIIGDVITYNIVKDEE